MKRFGWLVGLIVLVLSISAGAALQNYVALDKYETLPSYQRNPRSHLERVELGRSFSVDNYRAGAKLLDVAIGFGWQPPVENATNNSAPTPAGTQRYIAASGGTWTANKIYEYDTERSAWFSWTPVEGCTVWDKATNALLIYDGGSWVSYTSMEAASFAGGIISADCTLNNGVDLLSTTTTAHTNAIRGYDVDGEAYVDLLRWTNGNTVALVLGAATMDFSVASTGLDISAAGAISNATTIVASSTITGNAIVSTTTGTFGSGIVLDNAGTITNATDSEFKFTDASEDLSLDMDAAANVVGLKSSTGVNSIAFGTVDDLSGIGTIAFDAAASTITLTATDDAQDLTIGVAGAHNSSLILNSAGTAADALVIATSAGGMDIAVTGDAAGEDLDLSANTSINIKSSEAAADDSIVLQTLGAGSGIDITSLGDIDITTTGAAGEDISITNTGGSLLLRANENSADAIIIDTTGGGGESESINIANDQGEAESALDIDATKGGIDIDFATGKNFTINGGQFIVTSNEDVASAINFVTNTGTAETIVVTNTKGTGDGAITLAATVGGVDVDAAATKDLDLAGGQVNLVSKDDAAGAISLTTNKGTDETILLTNTQGTDNGAITLTATAGGITLASSAGLITGDPITGDGTAAISGFRKTVTNDTDGDTLTADDSGTVQTNAGASGAGNWILPSAAAGLHFTFVVMAAKELRVTPATGDKINDSGTAAAVGEYLVADAIGESITLVAVDADTWVVTAKTGTWTEATPPQ